MKELRSAGALTVDELILSGHRAEPPAPTGPRSCQSGRNPVGISPGFSWESHCRLLSPRRPEELGEAGKGGREGAGGEEELGGGSGGGGSGEGGRGGEEEGQSR